VGTRAPPDLRQLGHTTRHRLHRGGDRQLNRAIHIIALSRARTDPVTRAYLERKHAEGKTNSEPSAAQTPPRRTRVWVAGSGRISWIVASAMTGSPALSAAVADTTPPSLSGRALAELEVSSRNPGLT